MPPFESPTGGLRQIHNQAHRVWACCIIILGHCEQVLGLDPGLGGHSFQLGLNLWGQYTVPLFFALAGYSLAPKLTRPGSTLHAINYSRRILTMFVAASAGYFVLHALALAHPGQPLSSAFRNQTARVLRNPGEIALGTALHLWFLVALMLAVWTTTYVRNRTRLRYLFAVGAISHLLLLGTGPYTMLTLWPSIPYVWRMTLFLGTPFLAVGLALRHTKPLPRRWVAYLLIVAGVLMQIAEQYWRWTAWGLSPFGVGPLAGTSLTAVGMSLLAVRPGSSPISQMVARLGPFTLVAYLVHMAFIEVLLPRVSTLDRPTARWFFPLVVGTLSFGCAALYYWAVISIRRQVKKLRQAEIVD